MKKDVEFIRQWCIAILQFMADEYDEQESFQGRSYKQYYMMQMDVFINPPHLVLSGFKQAYNDINQLALREAKELKKLNAVLQEKFGCSLIDETALIEKTIKKIVKRGRISNDTEYDLVKSFIDDRINDGNADEELLEKLDALLFTNPDKM